MANTTVARRLAAGDLAPDVAIAGPGGAPVHLASLWESGPAVITFLRHFG